jgi:uncharacterized protein YhfF
LGKGQATEEQLNNPLHGVKLIQIVEYLVENLGWEEMANQVNINSFKNRPTVKSSLRFLRRTEWARKKVEDLYLECVTPPFHASVYKMWKEFQEANPNFANIEFTDSFHFCDNEKDAQECATLVKTSVKQATSTSKWWFEQHQEELPVIGNLYVICDWYGIAKAIVETTHIEQVPYKDITEEYAAIEGEGDKSLKHWKEIHWAYYTREMEEFGETPNEDMVIICERFKTLFS